MRYEYQITMADKSSEILKAMSFKKVLKQLLQKYPNEKIWLTYTNKKGHLLNKIIINGKAKNEQN